MKLLSSQKTKARFNEKSFENREILLRFLIISWTIISSSALSRSSNFSNTSFSFVRNTGYVSKKKIFKKTLKQWNRKGYFLGREEKSWRFFIQGRRFQSECEQLTLFWIAQTIQSLLVSTLKWKSKSQNENLKLVWYIMFNLVKVCDIWQSETL